MSCSTDRHRPVWFLGGTGAGNSSGRVVCDVPAGDYVFLPAPTLDCSTVEKPPFHGGTDGQLVRCARNLWRSAPTKVTASLDGAAIPSAPYIFATPTFSFKLPRRNVLQGTKLRGRAAVYGFSVMLRPLTPCTHTIHITVTHWIYKQATYILHVH